MKNNTVQVEKKKFETYISQLFQGVDRPLYGTIELTNACSYDCIHCFERDDRGKDVWTLDEVKKIIDEIVEEEGFALALSGGEPLLHPDFKDIYIYAKEKGLIVSVFSNLNYIDDKLLNLFKEYPVSSISTSCYGFSDETYEAVTKRKNSRKQFFENVNRLIEEEIPVDVKYFVLKENIHEALIAKEYFNNRQVPFVFSYLLRAMDSGNIDNLSHQITPKQAIQLELRDENKVEYWKNRYYSSDNSYDERIKAWNQKRKYLCPIGVKGYYISANKNFYLCSSERLHGYNLKEGSFKYAWNIFRKQVIKEKPLKHLKCLDCELFKLCTSCIGDNYFINNDEYKPVTYLCELAELRKKYIID